MEDHNSASNPTSMYDQSVDPALQKKRQAMIDRLSNRHQARVRSKESDSSPSFESTDTFLARFSDLQQSIVSEIDKIEQAPESFAKGDLDNVSALINDLEKLLAENTYHLPSYDVRASLKTISDLRESLDKVAVKLVPKKKFSFKTKAAKQNQKAIVEEQPEVVVSGDKSCIVFDTPGFKNREREVLVENLKGKDMGEFTLSDLGSCEVRLIGRSRAVFIHRVRNCKVYAGPALGSVLIDDVEGCVFVLASHQIRIHNARKCDFYLRVRSHPIIEDSSEVRFAPYCLQYDGIEEDLRESRLDEETGSWANVDDFKWLRAVQSPNWSVLPEHERISSLHVSISDS
ncbi:tubulin-folding cofactor C-like [Chenopodium quinoa]|uniref:C-CAP/cofactor C-like domain-containing protein n=1 Tax=Chenopodium quinoa TaxID=63459 RepID=A0A803MFN0_CHEQI|nr:tubulin-folding cofactor C-like [Chenopodium quinoa]XP_021762747.1 tubulin-folding cofactor C-like [Chenopodium quinoa]